MYEWKSYPDLIWILKLVNPLSTLGTSAWYVLQEILLNQQHKKVFAGSAAQARRGVLTLTYPVERGSVRGWEELVLVWRAAFNTELRSDPETKRLVILTEPDVGADTKVRLRKVRFTIAL